MLGIYFKCTLFIILALILGCHKSTAPSRLNSALPKARVYVEKYGQIISKKETDYLNYVQKRLSTVLAKSSGRVKNYKIILLNTKMPIAYYAGGEIILISKGILIPAKYESEFAFILAHEMAHQHLGHTPQEYELQNNAYSNLSSSSNQSDEIEADKLAVAIISAAGYDPRYAISALQNVYQYASPYITDKDNYPTVNTRISEIKNYIDSSGWKPPGTTNRREYTNFRKDLF